MFSIWDEDNDYDVTKDVLKNARNRLTLLNSIVYFIEEYQLNGVDMHWRWPKTKHESLKFSKFCEELRSQLPSVITITYYPIHCQADFNEILKHVDFVNVVTNNYYASWHFQASPQLASPPHCILDMKNSKIKT
ncbi:unnamed protein product [Caenorhabditis nigoni]